MSIQLTRQLPSGGLPPTRVDVATWYLEMLGPAELRAGPAPGADITVVRAEVPSPELNRFLYTAVGGDWYWTDRLCWSYAEWLAYLDRPELETWVAYASGTPAGYVELEAQPEGNVEIVYFGLLPRFVGRGIGRYLLSVAVQRAWAIGARRVWVHTCSLDGPYALANYRARGFRVYCEEVRAQELPGRPPGPWHGAHRHA